MEELIPALKEHLIIPILVVTGGALLLIVKSGIKRISDSIILSNDVAKMKEEMEIRTQIFKLIENSVRAAVASNMSLANEMKGEVGKLTEEQISFLNKSAIDMVFNTLPPSLTDEESPMLKLVGGREKLLEIAKSFMEKSVYDYELAKKGASFGSKDMLVKEKMMLEEMNKNDDFKPEDVEIPF